MARHRFRQSPDTKYYVSNKHYTCTAGGMEFSISTIGGSGGKVLYHGDVPGVDGTYVWGMGRKEIEDAIDAVIASRAI